MGGEDDVDYESNTQVGGSAGDAGSHDSQCRGEDSHGNSRSQLWPAGFYPIIVFVTLSDPDS